MLAYYTKAPFPSSNMVAAPRWWEAFPVVDHSAQWKCFTPIVLFDDSYAMGLLFFVSGLFSWRSLKHKGIASYLRSRFSRLGVPFLFMMLLAPATYFTVYLQGGLKDGFWHEWLQLDSWPAGPAWFVSTLLLFDLSGILLFRFAPRLLEATGKLIGGLRSPSGMILLLTGFSMLLFLPAYLRFGFYGAGVLFLPVSRIVHDFAYFLVGLALGSASFAVSREGDSLLSTGSRLPMLWLPLTISSALAFALWQGVTHLSHRHYGSAFWILLVGASYCLSSAVSTIALLSIFLRFVKRSNPAWNSLLACSFGIYLVHYFINAWIQYCFLSFQAPGWFKAPLVFCLTLALSWKLVAIARRSSRIASFL